MKRSRMLTEMTRFYTIRHVMVEQGYLTPAEFMQELLSRMEAKGMLPPALPILTPLDPDTATGEEGMTVWQPEVK